VTLDLHTKKPELEGQRRVTGKPKTARNLRGKAHRDGGLHADVHAPDDARYQFLRCRGLVVLEIPIGYLAVLPIGMAQVSSVIITAEVGKELRKGEEISYFQFGGSDIVVLFEAKSNIELPHMEIGKRHYLTGEQLGKARPNP